jgi:hypothetical protein
MRDTRAAQPRARLDLGSFAKIGFLTCQMPNANKIEFKSVRPRFLIFILFIVLLMLALLFWQRPAQPPAKTEQSPMTVQSTLPPVNSAGPAPMAPVVAQPRVQASVATNLEAKREAIIGQDISSKNMPIDFYGLVIDQDSNPLPGVKIKSSLRHWKMAPPDYGFIGADEIPLEATTGADGRFELTGASGDVFGVLLYKDGYEAGSEKNGFGAGSYSYANPVIFKMWKTGEKAQLVTGSKFWGIVPDGRVYTIDFLQGTKTESANTPGDIRISVLRSSQIQPRTKFNWSFSIQAIDGGLIETDDPFMYLAPGGGYESPYQFTMNATNADWKRELNGLQFYLKSRNGQLYGRVKFDIIPDYRDVSVFNVNWAVNPSGSRNLQP